MNFKGIENIISEHQHVVSSIFNSKEIKKAISEIINVIIKGLENNKKILLAGNGGSATDSQHLCSEFMGKLNFDRDSLPAISLMTDTSLISAISNDYSFEYVISRQKRHYVKKGIL